ncbi:MAG: cobalamin-binding protein [Ammonifex sp.]|jgi:iron complex transport system substrate-binding protein|nr:MAG: cobalamin-binding protein [Ammonifex sp.]
MKKTLVLLMALVLLISITGCGRQSIGEKVRPSGANREETPLVTLTDSLNRTVTIEKTPERIVSLAPSNTEILFALGLGGKVMGVTKYCDFPAEAGSKPQIGGFSDPNLEKILARQPDLVLATEKDQEMIAALGKQGIDVLAVSPKTVASVLENIKMVGKATGASAAADTVVSGLQKRIDAVTAKVQSVPANKRPKVFYELWPEPLTTAGSGTFIDDLIKLAGGVNVAGDAGKGYPEYSLEMLLAENPDVLINSYGHGKGNPAKEDIKARKGWGALNCVKNDRIYTVNADLVNRSGPRIVEGLEAFAKAIHPELFSKHEGKQ